MLNNFEDIWLLTISQLHSIHQKISQEYEILHRQLLHLESVLIEKKKTLSSLNTEIAVTDRRIKDNENYIFLVNKKYADMGDAFKLVMTEFEKKETQLFELKKKQQVLETNIANLKESIPNILTELVDIEAQTKTSIRRCEELEKEKKKLSDEIFIFLSETSFERDEFENKAEELNNTFIQSITARSAVNNLLKQAQKKNAKIHADIEELRTCIANSNEIKILKESIPIKEKENLSIGATLTEHQVDVRNKTKTIDLLMAEVDSLEKKILLIDDDKVLRVDTALSQFNRLKKESQTADTDREQGLDRIFDLIVEKIGLEENSDMILQRLDSLERDLLGCVKDSL